MSQPSLEQAAIAALHDIPAFNRVLKEQLNSIVEQTEKAAYQIISRLQTIDEVVLELNRSIISGQLGDEPHDRLSPRERNVMKVVAASGVKLSEMFMDTVANVQFQDVTRQQIEHVIAAMQRLDDHANAIVGLLETPAGATPPEMITLEKHLEEVFAGYVMEHQRDSHRSAMGEDNADPTGNPSDTPPAAASKVELF